MKMPKGSKVAVDQSLLVAHPRVQGQKLCVVDTILLFLARSLTERRPLKECYHWAGRLYSIQQIRVPPVYDPSSFYCIPTSVMGTHGVQLETHIPQIK